MKLYTKNIYEMAVHFLLVLVFLAVTSEAKKNQDERDCEVCIGTIEKFKQEISEELYADTVKLEAAFKKFCKKLPKGGKENRFCYFVGGTEDAATSTLNSVINPLSYHLPPSKICEKLKARDSQICELRFDVKPDFSKLNKMKVGELKKILSNWNEECKGCAEKSEFVKKVVELLPKYEPEEWKKVQAAGKSDL